MQRWAHQQQGLQDVLAAIAAGKRRIVLQSPTGMGKTVIMQDLALDYLRRKLRVILFTNRKLLIDQTSAVMDKADIPHGIIQPDADLQMHLPFQVAMMQTVHARVFKRKTMQLFDADLVLLDEGHLQGGDTAMEVLEAHHAQGAAIVAFTATPIDMGDWWDTLVVAGTASEGRRCGALLLATHYSPDEPDWKQFKKGAENTHKVTEKESRSAIMTPGVFGRVLDAYRQFNPDQRPTILFGPDVAGSIYFAEQFTQAGIVAAHIDGDDIWAHGRLYKSNREQRESVIAAVRDGRCKVICNRFVLREGLDLPELSHCILATVFGSLSSYLQSVGRLLRAHHSLDHVSIQDHGGHWWRFGSPNADRRWTLGQTNTMILGMHADRMRGLPSEGKPKPCPKCRAVQIWKSPKCQFCDFEAKPGMKFSRPVVQSDGTLREMSGDVFRKRPVYAQPSGPAKWKQVYFNSLKPGAVKVGRTFRQAAVMFAGENNWQWPNRKWPYMPISEIDWYRRVIDVPQEDLIQEE